MPPPKRKGKASARDEGGSAKRCKKKQEEDDDEEDAAITSNDDSDSDEFDPRRKKDLAKQQADLAVLRCRKLEEELSKQKKAFSAKTKADTVNFEKREAGMEKETARKIQETHVKGLGETEKWLQKYRELYAEHERLKHANAATTDKNNGTKKGMQTDAATTKDLQDQIAELQDSAVSTADTTATAISKHAAEMKDVQDIASIDIATVSQQLEECKSALAVTNAITTTIAAETAAAAAIAADITTTTKQHIKELQDLIIMGAQEHAVKVAAMETAAAAAASENNSANQCAAIKELNAAAAAAATTTAAVQKHRAEQCAEIQQLKATVATAADAEKHRAAQAADAEKHHAAQAADAEKYRANQCAEIKSLEDAAAVAARAMETYAAGNATMCAEIKILQAWVTRQKVVSFELDQAWMKDAAKKNTEIKKLKDDVAEAATTTTAVQKHRAEQCVEIQKLKATAAAAATLEKNRATDTEKNHAKQCAEIKTLKRMSKQEIDKMKQNMQQDAIAAEKILGSTNEKMVHLAASTASTVSLHATLAADATAKFATVAVELAQINKDMVNIKKDTSDKVATAAAATNVAEEDLAIERDTLAQMILWCNELQSRIDELVEVGVAAGAAAEVVNAIKNRRYKAPVPAEQA